MGILSKQLFTALYDKDAFLPVNTDYYKQLLADDDFMGVSSQVHSLLKQQGKLSDTPSFFQVHLKRKYEHALYQNLFIKNQTYQILNLFENLGIDVIPLKGVIFSEKYFGDIGARPTSDIDLLIKPVDLKLAVEAVKSAGFSIEGEEIPGHFHYSLSKKLPHSSFPLTVELHWNLLREKTANFKIAEFWAQATPFMEFKHVLELSEFHTFYMICLHGWRHNLDSLKYFMDMIQLLQLHNDKFDFSVLLDDARRHRTFKRMIRTLSIVYQEFSFLHTVKEFPIKKSRYYQTLFSNEKKTYKQYVDFIDYQFFSYDSIKHCLIEAGSWILPDKFELNAELHQRYRKHSAFWKYLFLYKKRLRSAYRVIFLNTKHNP